jgi:hypothetical protein
MSKSGSTWNLVPLLAPSTKRGKRGVLKALGLDLEEGQATYLLDPTFKTNAFGTLLMLEQTTSNPRLT